MRVRIEERGRELVEICTQKTWRVIVGIEINTVENISDIKKLEKFLVLLLNLKPLSQKMHPAHAKVANNINAVVENK